jgi:hypothetical protein
LNLQEDLCQTYLAGEYREIYLSVSDLPTTNEDWNFIVRSATDLILLEGARYNNNILEMCRARIVSKTSNANHVFNRMKKLISAACPERGLYTRTGVFYKKIYYSSDVLSYELHENLQEYKESFIYIQKLENGV